MTISALQAVPSATTVTRDGTKLAADFDSFLQLLTTQLQTQDPLSPMDAEQFTTQLVQFSAVEQAIQTNSQLESLVKLMQTTQHTAALQYVGATVDLDNGRILLPYGGGAEVAYTLAAPAARVELAIVDDSGAVVRRLAGPTGQGAQRVTWDGLGEDRLGSPSGSYGVRIEAIDAAGRPVPVDLKTTGEVEALLQTDGGLVLSVAGRAYPLDAVRAVRPPA
jgi:flagellar basal-body rod modification protein FlgD